jgi:hypothetical protein
MRGPFAAVAVAAFVSTFTLTACSPAPAPAVDPRVERFASLPDWRGYWISEGLTPDIHGFPQQQREMQQMYPLSGFTAPMNDAMRERFAAMLAGQGGRKAQGWGYPMMMNSAAPLQFHITPEETLIVNMYREVRHVHTDGRALPAEEDRWPTTWGDSVGRWEGDTLVIETVSVRDPTRFFFFSPPFTEQARYVERLRKVGPDRIESEFTIEDPASLTAPWTVKLAYTRLPEVDRLVHDDFANDRSELDGEAFTIVPPDPP